MIPVPLHISKEHRDGDGYRVSDCDRITVQPAGQVFSFVRPFADTKIIALFTRACTNIELGVIGGMKRPDPDLGAGVSAGDFIAKRQTPLHLSKRFVLE